MFNLPKIPMLTYRNTYKYVWASLAKTLSAMQETWVQSRGQEDPLEKKMAIHSSILAWRILWTEKPSRLQSTWSLSWCVIGSCLLKSPEATLAFAQHLPGTVASF